ncbi:CotH kinase family protein [Cohnella suwonensis]|uniref:CotH kinase family protein n=1 Tax=Cohnella suwonensis TaxID=696072 RepID=A0ABW0LZW2_9BACL
MKRQLTVPLLSAVLAIALLAALTWNARGTDGEEATTARTQMSAGAETADEADQAVFPKDKVADVKITIDEDDFQDMMDNASAEELKHASVEYNGIKLDNIGIRTKGNLSLRSVVNSDSDRYSFKLSFDEYISSQTLMGIGKINLNNSYSDATYMREFLTYELAESMGLPTPKYSYVNVYVNGELYGFYLAIEQVGDAYLERNFGNSYGALYKAEFNGSGAVGGDLLWQGDDLDSYTALVQKSEKSNDGVLTDMLDELNNGDDYRKVLDVEDALKYIALNAVTVNMDSYLGSNKQNYYLYEDDGVFSILPWDYNMAFGGMGSSSQVMIDEPTQGAVTERPLVAKLLGVAEYKEKYHEIIQSMVDGYLSDAKFQERVKQLQELISPYVKADPRPFSTYDQYESAIPQLVTFTSARVENVSGQLNGTIASSGDGSGSGGGMGGFGGGRGGNGRRTDQAQQQQQQPDQAAAARPDANVAAAEAKQGAVSGQYGQTGQQGLPQGGQFPQGGPDGQMPDGFGGGQGGMGGGFQGGFGGDRGGMMGINGQAGAATEGGSEDAAITTAISLGVLALAGLFVAFYRRKRL